jgi:hypothetical protein
MHGAVKRELWADPEKVTTVGYYVYSRTVTAEEAATHQHPPFTTEYYVEWASSTRKEQTQ